MKLIKIYLTKIHLIIFLFLSFSFQQVNYTRYYLNNTEELSLLSNDVTDYLLYANISNSSIGDIIHIVFNIQDKNYSIEDINYFFLQNEIDNLDNITIPEVTEGVNIKNSRIFEYFITLYIDIEKKNESNSLIFLLRNMPTEVNNFAIITDIDESNLVEIKQDKEQKLTFDGKNPLLFFYYFTSYYELDFKISSNVSILEEESNLKYYACLPPFTTFQMKELSNFSALYPHLYQIKDEKNFSYYGSIYSGFSPDPMKYTILAFKFYLTKPGELTFQFLKNQKVEIKKDINLNNEYSYQTNNNINIYFIQTNYFIIKQAISNSINIFYSISKEHQSKDEFIFDIKNLSCIEKTSNEYFYKYCNISLLPEYESRYLIIFPNNPPFSLRISNSNEGNINNIAINSSQSYLLQQLSYELFGFTDSNYNNSFYVIVIAHGFLGGEKFKHYLINKPLNDIYELKDEKDIILNHTFLQIDMERYYYFWTEQIFESGQQSLIIELESYSNMNYTIERTMTYDIPNEFCNISRNETKEITKIQNRNLFIIFNLTDIKDDERILIKIEGLKSAFRENKIFYSDKEELEINETEYSTSDKCSNELNNDKIIFICNYTENEVSKLKFLIFVNYEANITISNSKDTKEKNKDPDQNNEAPKSNYLPLIIIIGVIIIAIIAFLIRRKLKKDNIIDTNFNVSEGILNNK